MERIYIFALMWSIGALLELDDRARLEKFWRTELSVKLDLPFVDDSKSETVFEYFVGPNGTSTLFTSHQYKRERSLDLIN